MFWRTDTVAKRPMKLLTQSGYAKHRRISRQRVSQLVKAGKIEVIDGRIDVARADASLGPRRRIRTPKKRKLKTEPPSTVVTVPMRALLYTCDRCSMQIPVKPGTILPAAIRCTNCGADLMVVELAELKMKETLLG